MQVKFLLRGGIQTHFATLSVDSTFRGMGVLKFDVSTVAQIFVCVIFLLAAFFIKISVYLNDVLVC